MKILRRTSQVSREHSTSGSAESVSEKNDLLEEESGMSSVIIVAGVVDWHRVVRNGSSTGVLCRTG